MDNLPQNNTNPPTRITWNSIWLDFLSVINFDRGILFTIKGLLISPKQTVDDYLFGNRSMHANPLRFLLFSTAIVTLLNFYLVLEPSLDNGMFDTTDESSGYSIGEEFGRSMVITINSDDVDSLSIESDSNTVQKAVPENKGISEIQKKELIEVTMDKLFSWMDKLTFAMVPIFALFTFLFFRKTGYNYTENLVINALMISMTNVMGIFLSVPTYFSPLVGGSVLGMISIIYMIYFMYQVFGISGFKSFLKVFVSIVFSYFLFFTIMIMLLLYFINDYMQTVGGV